MCRDALENSGNYYNLHSSIMANGMLCPVLFKSYAVYATRGAISNMYPAIDNVFHTSNGRTLSDAIMAAPEGTEADETEDGEAEEGEDGDGTEDAGSGEETWDETGDEAWDETGEEVWDEAWEG